MEAWLEQIRGQVGTPRRVSLRQRNRKGPRGRPAPT